MYIQINIHCVCMCVTYIDDPWVSIEMVIRIWLYNTTVKYVYTVTHAFSKELFT